MFSLRNFRILTTTLPATLTLTLNATLALAMLLSSCTQENVSPRAESPASPTADQPAVNALSSDQVSDGWTLLFDGKTMDHFRGYQAEEMPTGWAIKDGTMTIAEPTHGGDIVTREKYQNFELKLEWKVPEEGNSGIMFHVSEDHGSPWETGPEMQILDNAAFEGGALGKNSAGSNYDVDPPAADVAKPAGEWNNVHMIVNGPHVEHWMNGTTVVEYELWTDDWRAKVKGSKWLNYPDYGMRSTGYIALQGDHSPVAFRNIRIKRLPDSESVMPSSDS